MIDLQLADGLPVELRRCDRVELETRLDRDELLRRVAGIGADGGVPARYRSGADVALTDARAVVTGDSFVLRGGSFKWWRKSQGAVWRGVVLPRAGVGTGCRVRARAGPSRLVLVSWVAMTIWFGALSLVMLINGPLPEVLVVDGILWVAFGIIFMVQRDRAWPVSRGLLFLLSVVIEAESGDCVP
jgi:uncharacterized MAPEG superfamily protein